MIDFEQLKINNVDLNEKIEERNEDILKLKRKVTATVQVLTHVKEKLQFLQVPHYTIVCWVIILHWRFVCSYFQAENSEKRAKLREVEAVVAKVHIHLLPRPPTLYSSLCNSIVYMEAEQWYVLCSLVSVYYCQRKKKMCNYVNVFILQKRDHLTRMKQARDCLRTDNVRLRQKGGLVSHSGLLRDFEEKRDQV